jgi:hypothetical protein
MPRSRHSFDLLTNAYKRVAKKLRYRPGHYGDSFGGCTLTAEQVADPALLHKEATAYVANFIKQEDDGNFRIGCSDGRVLGAFYYTILAAGVMCTGAGTAVKIGLPLLQWAIKDLEKAKLKRDSGL